MHVSPLGVVELAFFLRERFSRGPVARAPGDVCLDERVPKGAGSKYAVAMSGLVRLGHGCGIRVVGCGVWQRFVERKPERR